MRPDSPTLAELSKTDNEYESDFEAEKETAKVICNSVLQIFLMVQKDQCLTEPDFFMMRKLCLGYEYKDELTKVFQLHNIIFEVEVEYY